MCCFTDLGQEKLRLLETRAKERQRQEAASVGPLSFIGVVGCRSRDGQ